MGRNSLFEGIVPFFLNHSSSRRLACNKGDNKKHLLETAHLNDDLNVLSLRVTDFKVQFMVVSKPV